ncbi:MAG TPA: ubiquitin-like protein UBact [Armatimonadota bacterium]|jgi:hypothetical protein
MTAVFEERRQLPTPEPERRLGDGGGGPGRPDVKRPDTRKLMDRMKRVDPDQAKRYRQRSGQ